MRRPAWPFFPLLLTLLAQVHGDCPTPPSQLHATLQSGELKDSYPVGTVLRYSCIPGYKFIDRSKPFIECLDSSEWSTTPTFCERKQCKPPRVENGGIKSMDDLRLGEEITYVCDRGYRPVGKTTARCTLFEGNKVQWDTDPPLCERIPCERPPTIVNGTHSGDTSLDHYTVGDVVMYRCRGDLSLIGNSSIVCITTEDGINGIWDRPAPECKAVQCSRPRIQNGRLTSAFQPIYKYEHVLQFACDSGYSLVGHEFVKCGADNKWQPELPACVKVVQCSRPQIQNGKLTTAFQPSYQYEHVLQFVCDAGYTMVGSEFVKCGADNMWHPELPTCVKVVQCSRPQIQNGKLTTAFQPSYQYEHVLQFVCDAGYTMVGSEFVKCGADNMWHPELPTCVKVVQCSRPQIQNGKLTTGFQPSYQHEHVLQFVCDAGYTMVGSEFVKCGADNMWHPEFPTCVKEATQSPGGTIPNDDSGNNTVGIVVGVLVGVLVLAAAIFVLIKWKPCLKKGKSDSHPNSTDSYHPVPGKDIVLEEKSRP